MQDYGIDDKNVKLNLWLLLDSYFIQYRRSSQHHSSRGEAVLQYHRTVFLNLKCWEPKISHKASKNGLQAGPLQWLPPPLLYSGNQDWTLKQ